MTQENKCCPDPCVAAIRRASAILWSQKPVVVKRKWTRPIKTPRAPEPHTPKQRVHWLFQRPREEGGGGEGGRGEGGEGEVFFPSPCGSQRANSSRQARKQHPYPLTISLASSACYLRQSSRWSSGRPGSCYTDQPGLELTKICPPNRRMPSSKHYGL